MNQPILITLTTLDRLPPLSIQQLTTPAAQGTHHKADSAASFTYGGCPRDPVEQNTQFALLLQLNHLISSSNQPPLDKNKWHPHFFCVH
ncbi:hypothetical protein LguiA_032366 [Lonicera macranthoides]